MSAAAPRGDDGSRKAENEKHDAVISDQITAHLDSLQNLLEQKKQKEDEQLKLYANCSQAGKDYSACNPLIPGNCPPESDFKTTFADMPWKSSFAKDPKTGEMVRCIPNFLVGVPDATKKSKEDSWEARLLRAAAKIEREYPKMVQASQFQWTQPCGEAKTRDQCEILRTEPRRDATTGELRYGEHGDRCYWAPDEDLTVYNEANFTTEYKEGENMCRERRETPYATRPMTQKHIRKIQEKMKEKGVHDQDPNVGELRVTNDYGVTRKYIANEGDVIYRDLHRAYVQLPLLPLDITRAATSALLASANVNKEAKMTATAIDELIAQIPSLDQYVFANEPTRHHTDGTMVQDQVLELNGDKIKNVLVHSRNEKTDSPTRAQVLDGSYRVDFKKLRELGKKLEDLCDKENSDGAQYTWNSPFLMQDRDDSASKTFMDNLLLPSSFEGKTGLRKTTHDKAKKDWWKFAHNGVHEQGRFAHDFVSLVTRIHEHLKTPEKRAKFEKAMVCPNGKCADASGDGEKDQVTADLTPLKGLNDSLKTMGFSEIFSNMPSLDNTGSYATEGTMEELTPKFADAAVNDEAARLATSIKLVTALVQQAGKSDSIVATVDRALYKAGIGNNASLRWRARAKADVHVPTFDPIHETDEDKLARLDDAVKAVERMEVANKLKSHIKSEIRQKRSNRILGAYFHALADTRNPQQRYHVAMMQVPKLVKYSKEHEGTTLTLSKIFDLTHGEIKRRFNAPPHPIFYDAKVANSAGWTALRVQETIGKDVADPLQSHQLAAQFVSDAVEMYEEKEKEKQQQEAKEVEEDKSIRRGPRSLRNLNEAIKRRGEGLRIEEKYGADTYVDVRTGNRLPALEAHVLARTR